ncbi:uncharacterized protein PV09_09085 [Verruconis gallopava]|uniref:RNA exonuclease 4 n=1 Tax=Verruconis gallopava TaxID=253628 RepID=A0A0D1YEQ3_9PEZI|nr:uncharacterized protein PV09_09085 [Verruconis gallopava]KIV99221.1 hypothetical protein PV09_09085 [Verruconis gallopava]
MQCAMAPMDLSQLSSNWKKLQATLPKKADKGSIALKRKRPDATKEKPSKKRQRLDSATATVHTNKSKDSMNNSHASKRMRHSKSAPDLKERTKDSKDGEQDAEENERPSSAQDVRDKLSESEAQVNEGVSQTAIAGKYIALDCEMVGYGPNPRSDSQVARVSIVNYHGEQIYDSFVLPQVPVTDYRTAITGLTESSLKAGRPFKEVQRDVATFLKGRVLIGHALKGDLDVLMLTHPRRDIRDTSRHAPYRALSAGKTPALRMLCKEVLGLEIQSGHHSSVEDARAAMLLYRKEKDAFEAEYAAKFGRRALLSSAESIVEGRSSGSSKKKKKKGKR